MTEPEEDQLLSGMANEFQNAVPNSTIDRNSSRVTQLLYALKQFFINYKKVPQLSTVTTFAQAKTMTTPGVSSSYIITSDEDYGTSLVYYNGTSYFVSPLIPRA